MEAKKNPVYDLSRQRNKFFLIGLSISIGIAISAFEWTTVKVQYKPKEFDPASNEPIHFIPAVKTKSPTPEVIKKKEAEQKQTNSASPTSIIEVSNNTPVENPTPNINFENQEPIAVIASIDTELTDTIHVFPERHPEPLNGYKAFYNQLGKSIKYPTQAKKVGTEGKVFVEFIINKNGEPTDLKILRGIGSGCDEEAMRVLSLTKWEPGKQRGKPVRVKMVLPVYFMLSN